MRRDLPERELTRGWLKASNRALDEDRSTPWKPWHKLTRAGIRQYFRFGAFGEMAPTRGDLAKLAIGQARSEGLIDTGSRISLIGDAGSDILAARDAGIQSISVRTGIAPLEELEMAGPDWLIADLTRLDLAII